METLHARYPFLDESAAAVEAAGIDLGDLVADDDAVVSRALARVEAAIDEGTVGTSSGSVRVELLSYPVARVLVSLVDERALTRKYVRAEARTARERMLADANADELSASSYQPPSISRFLSEFDLDREIRRTNDGYEVAVGRYLTLASEARGDGWRLVNRDLRDGWVPIDDEELYELLEGAVGERVGEGLPLSVPEPIAERLDEEVTAVRERLSDLTVVREIDSVVPELFPPCMKSLLDRIRKGEHLAHHSRFAITAFLASIGMTTDEIVDLYEVNPGFGEQMTRYQTDHIRGENGPTEYSPPSCATMQTYGDCVNMDDRCERIAHPLAYYEAALDEEDGEELPDWRERA